MKIHQLVFLVLFTISSSNAIASSGCDQERTQLHSIDDKLACAEQAVARAKLAKKLLDQRLGDFVDRTNDMKEKDDGRRIAMVSAAVKAKETLGNVNTKLGKLDETNKGLHDDYLLLKGAKPISVAISGDAAKDARAKAIVARDAFKVSEMADLAVIHALEHLASIKETDSEALRTAIKELDLRSEEANSRKKAWGKAKDAILQDAASLVSAAATQKDPLQEWNTKLISLINDGKEIVDTSNAAMVSLMDTTETDKERLKKAEKFLVFMENHPLLNSELSGSGVQFTSTAGDGKITLKQAFQWGRTASQRLAISLSAPTGDDNPMKNSVLLDKLEGNTTIKLDYAKINDVNDIAKLLNSYTIWGGSGEFGYQKFSYYDAATSFADPSKPIKVETHNKSYSMAGFVGLAPESWNTLFLLRFARQYQREKSNTAVICPSMPVAATWVACNSGPMGEPAGKKFNIWSGEVRKQFNTFAMSGILSYDKTSKVRAIALPVYLSVFNSGFGVFGGGDTKLSAGVIAGWRSDTGTSFGIFAGMPFSLASGN